MNYPDNFKGTNMDATGDAGTNAALDAIDGLAKQLISIADAVTMIDPIRVTQIDWQNFKGAIEDAVSDLFHSERERLMELGGWREKPKTMVHQYGRVGNALLSALSATKEPEYEGGHWFRDLLNADGTPK